MKLTWKLNACVLLFCLSISLCAEISNLNSNNVENLNTVSNNISLKTVNNLAISHNNQLKSLLSTEIKSNNSNSAETQVKATSLVSSQAENKASVTSTVQVTTSTSATSQTEADKKKHSHSHKKNDMYSANEKMLNKKEKTKKHSNNDIHDKHHSFMQHKDKLSLENSGLASHTSESSTSGIKFVHKKNAKLKMTKEWITYNKCHEQKGFLEIIQNEDTKKKKVNLINTRVVLNHDSLRLYTTMENKSLFSTIKLEGILKISQEEAYKNSGCFDVILNKAFSKEKFLQKRRITLCAPDAKKMGEWVHAIYEFKECGRDQPSPKGSKIVLDFNEMNKIKKSDKKDMYNLWYDNTNKTPRNKVLSSKERVIVNTVNKLISNIEEKNYALVKTEREMNGKLKEAQKFTREMDKKQDLIKRIIKKKVEHQNALQVKKAQKTAVGKEVRLITAMAAKINSLKTKEIVNIKKIKQKEIKQQKVQAAKSAAKMMTTLVKAKRIMPYHRCVDPRLKYFKDTTFIQDVCYQIFGLVGQGICQKKENFCNKCCRHHIGVRLVMTYEDCFFRCRNLIFNGVDKLE